MNRRAGMLALLMGVVALAAPAGAQEAKSTWERIMSTKTLRVGFALGEPYAFKDVTNSSAPGGIKVGDATWRGFGPVVGQKIADALQVKLEVVESSHASSIAGLQADLIDVFLPVGPTPERARSADFIPAPIIWFAMTYYSRTNDAPATWKELNDSKYKIGVVLGAHTDDFATTKLSKTQIQRFPSPNEQISALQTGRVDGIIALGPVAIAAYSKLKMGKLVTPTPRDVSSSSVAIRQEADQRWRNYLTTAIRYYYDNGIMDDIFNDFLAFRGIDPETVLPISRENWPPQR
jgi:polar amino acid transport system substrate-binding protein